MVGVIDMARLARTTHGLADVAEQPRLLPAMMAGRVSESLLRQGKLVGEEIEVLSAAQQRGELTDATDAIGHLRTAQDRIDTARTAVEEGTVVRRRDSLRWLGSLGDSKATVEHVRTSAGLAQTLNVISRRADMRAAVEPLRESASAIEQARAALDLIPEVQVISRENSQWIRAVGEASDDAGRIIAGTSADPATLAPGVRAMLDFSPETQQRVRTAYANTVARLIGMRHEHLERVPAQGGHVVTGTHVGTKDVLELVNTLEQGGGGMVRALGAKNVTAAAGSFGRALGAFPTVRVMPDGTVAKGKEAVPAMLAQGDNVLLYPEGNVFPFTGGVSTEPVNGVATFSLDAGAPILPTATYGLQGKAFLGEAAAGRRPVTVVGETIGVRRLPAGASEELREAATREVREVYAQAHDSLLNQAYGSWLAQRP